MGENSKIEWCTHTFNAWEGCIKVSEACKNCYAESRDHRIHRGQHWGPGSRRKFHTDAYWSQLARWNKEAREAGERHRVFCGSLMDICEILPDDHPDAQAMQAARLRLCTGIDAFTSLDFLLLTKRPENFQKCLPFDRRWPANVVVMTTVENQERADERIPHLLKVPAHRRGLSCEPLLGPMDLSAWFWTKGGTIPPRHTIHVRSSLNMIHWVIAGGESGPHARPSHPNWFRSLRDQCQEAGVAFHFKQWGCWVPERNWCSELGVKPENAEIMYLHPDGTFEKDGGAQRSVQHASFMVRCDKKKAGRTLDGQTWDEFPEVTTQ